MRTAWRIVQWGTLLGLGLMLASVWSALLFANGMVQVMAWYFIASVPFVAVVALAMIGAYALIRRRRSSPVLVSLGLAVAGAWPILWNFEMLLFPFPRSLDATVPALAVRLPLDAPVRAFWGGDQLEGNYHRFSPDQTWAYDLGVEPADTVATRNEDFGCWGLPVVAPARGVVALAEDGHYAFNG